jgi:hypothetical protein
MESQFYVDSLPLSEKLHRSSPDLTSRIYSESIQQFLRDGVVIFPGVIPIQTLDQLDRDLETLTNLSTAPEIYGSIGIDGPRKYYEAKHLRNLSIDDFRKEPPGLKLLDLQRYFESAKQLAFASAVTSFMEELFGSPAALIQSLTFWKSSEQPIHQDFSYVHHHRKLGELAAAWIPLEDIHADAGPLVYITKDPIIPTNLASTIGAMAPYWLAVMPNQAFSLATPNIWKRLSEIANYSPVSSFRSEETC